MGQWVADGGAVLLSTILKETPDQEGLSQQGFWIKQTKF